MTTNRRGRDSLVGSPLFGRAGERIGRVEAVFVDYLLVRTAGVLPIDLYVPRPEVREAPDGAHAECGARDARRRWHRPLKRAPHD